MTQLTLFKDPKSQEQMACSLLRTITGLSVEHCEQIVRRMGGVHKLAQAHESALAHQPGIGPKRAAKIKALTHWALLLQEVEVAEQVTIRTPTDIARLLQLEMSLLEKEELRVVVLDTKNNVRTIDTVYRGSVNAAVVRIAEVFRAAILYNGVSIILAHNHPTGSVEPSPEDVRVTELLYQTGRSLDIAVLDHLIFAGNRYISLKERGLGFTTS